MKNAILFLGVLCCLLITNSSFAQVTSKSQRTIEKDTVQQKIKLPDSKKGPIRAVKKESTYHVEQQKGMVVKRPLKRRVELERKETFDSEEFINRALRSRLETIGSGFNADDNSTLSIAPGEQKGNEFCTTTTLNTDINTTSFRDFTVNGPPDWLKPGIIMDAVSFVRGEDRIEERYNRGPITISTTAVSAKESNVIVENPKNRSEITGALSDLLSTDRNQQHAANISYSYSEVYSKDELNYKINGRYSNDFYGISSKLGLTSNSEKERHYYLVEFRQILFSLEVDGLDKTNIFPDNPEVELYDYVYLSKVNYGRKGYFMFITNTSLESLNVNSEASSDFMGHNVAVEANFEQLATSKGVEVKAFYYGGSVDSVIEDLTADRESDNWKPLDHYVKGYEFSEAEAYPISYELKNLDNKRVGMNSKNNQTIETCIPYNTVKLKVTLLELQCDTSGDDDGKGDFGITQHVRYTANGQVNLPISTDIRLFNDNCDPGDINTEWDGAKALICGGMNNQIHVNESDKPTRRNPNINNSMVFEITPAEANDKNAEFLIDTWVKEYSSGAFGRDDVVMNHDPRKKKVAIHDVIAILNGTKELDATNSFFDSDVNSNLKFDNFDGISLPLRKVDYPGKMILEGPIRARNNGTDLNKKAFVWMQFELID